MQRVSPLDADAVVVGAGVIGLASALAISESGRSVCVLDPAPGSGASRAAAGMLAPGAEWSVEDVTLGQQMRDARASWPEFAHHLEKAADVRVPVREVGSLFVAWNESDRREWRRHLDVIAAQGIATTDVARDGADALFASITPRIASGAFIADDAYVDPDQVVDSLLAALARTGVEVRPWAAQSLSVEGAGVCVRTADGDVRARCGLVATGAVSTVTVDDVVAANRVRPVRGVTLRLAAPAPERAWMVRGIVMGRHLYVIARDDGSVVVGASSDESAEVVVAARDVRQLLDDASMVVPSLDEARFLEARVGLRPAPESNRPFFERLGSTGWAWSGGYFRHGYLLAPLAARRAREFAEELT